MRLQRFPPVKIARNRKKNPRNPQNESILYAMSPNPPRKSMREVTFILKANPASNPASPITKIFLFVFQLFFQRETRVMNAAILIARRAGSSFISFAC